MSPGEASTPFAVRVDIDFHVVRPHTRHSFTLPTTVDPSHAGGTSRPTGVDSHEENPMRTAIAALLAAIGGAGLTFLLVPRVTTSHELASPESRTTQSTPFENPPSELGASGPIANEFAALRSQVRELQLRLQVASSMPDASPETTSVHATSRDVATMQVPALIDLATTIRKRVEDVLLTPPENIKNRYASLLSRPDAGVGRILPRGKFDHVIEKRGGGAYYSFATRDNSYDKEPDLGLEGGNYRSGFYGGTFGYVLDVGAVSIEAVPDSPTVIPPGLDEKSRAIWEFLWSDAESTLHGVSKDFERRKSSLGASRGSPTAQLGHAYVVRAVLLGEHDHLVAFAPVDDDQFGQTLVWRILKNWPLTEFRHK